MGDHVRFTQELTWVRRRQPALRGENIHVFHIHNGNRIIAFHRWLENIGQDVVVVASLNESTFFDYQLGFPGSGSWLEIFNSDIYDHWVNPNGAGNGGQIAAQGPPTHGLPCSAKIVIPANAILVFARNAVNIDSIVIVNRATAGLVRALAQRGFEVLQTPLSEFMKAGGSAKCLTLRLDEP